MVVLKERYAEIMKELLLHCCNRAWMKNGALILWNAVAICEMSRTSWQKGKLCMKDDLEKHSKGQFSLLDQWLNIIRLHRKIRRGFYPFGKKVLPAIFLGYELITGRNLERRYFDSRLGRIGKFGCFKYLSSKNQRERSLDITKERRIHIPSCRWNSKIVGKRLRIPRTHSKAGANGKERRSQRRTSRQTGRASADRIKR